MAKIYISYQHTDLEVVRKISNQLRSRGHEILMDELVLKVGNDWRKVLLESLRNADGVLVLITERSLQSNYVVSEIGTARAYVAESFNKKFIIPVIYGEIPIPNFIEDLFCIRLQDDHFQEAIDRIDASISSFLGRKEAAIENQSKEQQKVEVNAADFIKLATRTLKRREWTNGLVALICYAFGIWMLLRGISAGVEGFKSFENIQARLEEHPNQIWGIYVLVVLKSLIIIGLLIAASKYAFILGKSFMHESVRNADRVHAISFGEFYLKAYGDKLGSHTEIKEIFQDWNIDKPTPFSTIDTNSYDPKLSESLLEVIKNLSNKVKGAD